jgi:hypothetical protein
MSHCDAARCTVRSSPEICVKNSIDRALSGKRIVTGASTVSRPAAMPLPRNNRRQRRFKGSSRNARNAAQVIAPKNGVKILTRATARAAATTSANTR